MISEKKSVEGHLNCWTFDFQSDLWCSCCAMLAWVRKIAILQSYLFNREYKWHRTKNLNSPWISHRAIMSLALHSTLLFLFLCTHWVLQYPGWAFCSSISGNIPSYICVQLGNQRGAPLAYILLKRTLKNLPPTSRTPRTLPHSHPAKGTLPSGKVWNLSAHSCPLCRHRSSPSCWLRLWKLHSAKLWDYSRRGIFRVIIKGFAEKKKKKKIICRKQFEDMQTEQGAGNAAAGGCFSLKPCCYDSFISTVCVNVCVCF